VALAEHDIIALGMEVAVAQHLSNKAKTPKP
jgi:hypothetical protein